MAKSITGNSAVDSYVKLNADTGVINRGIRIFNLNRFKLVRLDEALGGYAEFRVQSDDSTSKYEVVLKNFRPGYQPTGACGCPYNWGLVCKHQVAAWMALVPLIAEPPKIQHMLDTTVMLPDLADQHLIAFVPESAWKLRNHVSKAVIVSAKNGAAEIQIPYKKEEFIVKLSKLKGSAIHTSCSCNAEQFEPLCFHKLLALILLRNQFGKRAFETMNRDWERDKNKLLADYGFSLTDDLKGKFDFKIDDDGNLNLLIVDPSIQKINQDWQQIGARWQKPLSTKPTITAPAKRPDSYQRVLLFVLSKQPDKALPGVKLIPLFARESVKNSKVTHLKELRYGTLEDLPVITDTDQRIIALANEFSTESLHTLLRKENLLIQSYYYNYGPVILTTEATDFAREWEGHILEQLFGLLTGKRIFLNTEGAYTSVQQIQPVMLSTDRLKPHFELREDQDMVVLDATVQIDGNHIPLKKVERPAGSWLIRYNNFLYKLGNVADVTLLEQFSEAGQMRVRKEYLGNFFQQYVVPMANQFDVNIKLDRAIETSQLQFLEARLYLKEDENHIIFIPEYVYQLPDTHLNPASIPGNALFFAHDGRSSQMNYQDDQIQVLQRDPEAEATIYQFLQDLHPDFPQQGNINFLYLPFEQLLENNWFINFFEQLKARGIPVFGFKDLKKFKYNPNRGEFKIKAGSGIDWFDLKIEMQFGDQFASLTDVRKAILNHQNYVPLKDGSLGILPQEWLDKYSQLLKIGQVKGDSIRVSKLHFAIIDTLYEQIDSELVREEITQKKQKLLNFKQIQNVPLPVNVQATLRDYQIEGYKWLHFLDEFGWGGILADDMGLGKTLQILTFIRALKNRRPDAVVLVVLPTSLIFNWQAEVDKFCPDLRVLVHRGTDRVKTTRSFRDCDIVLTTYGMVRSDIAWLREFVFEYVILDESQAIKNADSLAAKAVKLLQAKNRLVMTGTPVENNTFDLYSQMEFLNPGLLGSQEFFRTEYANPIDRHQDRDKAADLRRLIRPFMLKRTKEEVAKDLPDKTETVLFCEMGKKQRKVYDAMRETYRKRITEEMALVGKEKASFLILEGLLKLRQICDSPALLSDDADYGQESAKLDELVREIEENASNHKIIIFSQFLKMLDLLRQHLEKHHIAFEYLDGQTTDRAARVNRFQSDQQCRVFLMSLKAGGVGLNLTEADYVYLVDPWWNPAVEQQAIDRTHRIGQTRKVFAYRMICKDTVEEKILELQDRKRDIAADLISTEAGFIKKLTQDDIVGLFS